MNFNKEGDTFAVVINSKGKIIANLSVKQDLSGIKDFKKKMNNESHEFTWSLKIFSFILIIRILFFSI